MDGGTTEPGGDASVIEAAAVLSFLISCGHEATRLHRSCDNNSIITPAVVLGRVTAGPESHTARALYVTCHSTITDSCDKAVTL